MLRHLLRTLIASGVVACQVAICAAAPPRLEVQQLTQGPLHHFFGYIGHVQNIPWNGDGRYITVLRTSVL